MAEGKYRQSYYDYDRPSLELETVDTATHRYRWHTERKACYWDDVRAIAWEDIMGTRYAGELVAGIGILELTLADGERLTIDNMDSWQFIYLLMGVPADFCYEGDSVCRIVPREW